MRNALVVTAVVLVGVSAFAISTPVPEPTSVVLMVSGIAALALKLRKK